MFRRLARGVLGGLGFMALCPCGPAPLQPREPTPGADHFRIATFNVYYGGFLDRQTVDAVGSLDASIVCLQETNARWEQTLREAYSTRWPHMVFHHRPSTSSAGGLGILSKWPIVDAGHIESPEGWHPAWRVEVQTPAGPISILNVHLRSLFSGGRGALAAAANVGPDHLREITAFWQPREDGMPSIIVGDFNESPDGHAIDFLEKQGFRNILPLYHPGQETWHASSLAGQLGETVDHILFDDAFEPLDAWVVRRGASDHWPVMAHLELGN